MNLPLPLKLTLRELRRPGRSLRVMMLAVTVGVAALTAVAGFAERVDLALQQRSAQLRFFLSGSSTPKSPRIGT